MVAASLSLSPSLFFIFSFHPSLFSIKAGRRGTVAISVSGAGQGDGSPCSPRGRAVRRILNVKIRNKSNNSNYSFVFRFASPSHFLLFISLTPDPWIMFFSLISLCFLKLSSFSRFLAFFLSSSLPNLSTWSFHLTHSLTHSFFLSFFLFLFSILFHFFSPLSHPPSSSTQTGHASATGSPAYPQGTGAFNQAVSIGGKKMLGSEWERYKPGN